MTRGWEDRCAVGGHLDRRGTEGEGSDEELTCRGGVAGGRDEHVDDLPVLIDRPIYVAPAAGHLDIGLVDEPALTGRMAGWAGGVNKLRRLVDDGYRVDWFCYLGSHAAEHAAELPRDLLAELLDLPGALILDVYRDGPDDD